MRGWALICSSALLVGLAGCYPEYHPEDHGVGDAVVHNVVEQVVDPKPNETIAPPNLDGNRAAAAYTRYQADKVIQPLGESVSGLGGGSGGAAPGGAGAAVGVAPQ